MKFCWTTLHVSDFEKSLHFYRDLIGLPVSSNSTHGGVSIAMLGPENAPKIELLYDGTDSHGIGEGISIGFEVEDLTYATKTMADHGYPLRRGPLSPNPHIRFSFFTDPDGYEVQLAENLSGNRE